jgi:hypothetical protein
MARGLDNQNARYFGKREEGIKVSRRKQQRFVLDSFKKMKMPLPISFALVGLLINKDNVKLSNWPTVQGVVTVSDKKVAHLTGSSKSERLTGWEPIVEYDYKVDGVLFTGRSISHTSYEEVINLPPGAHDYADSIPSQRFQDLLKKYAVGNQVTVHYDPLNPKVSVLQIDLSGTKIFGGVTVLGLLVIIVSLIFYFLHKDK